MFILGVSAFYHDSAACLIKDGEIISNGGRVLNITSTGKNYLKIRKRIISIIRALNWKDGFYRKDIGWKVIHN